MSKPHTSPVRVCKHGNDKRWLCPDCDHERARKRQRQADRARFAAQIARVKGQGGAA